MDVFKTPSDSAAYKSQCGQPILGQCSLYIPPGGIEKEHCIDLLGLSQKSRSIKYNLARTSSRIATPPTNSYKLLHFEKSTNSYNFLQKLEF